MVNLYKYSIKTWVVVTAIVGLSLITGCDHANKFQDLEKHSEEFRQPEQQKSEEGKKLTDVAGRASLPPTNKPTSHKLKLSKTAENIVGRYRVLIDCKDAFVQCEKGTAEFILNLLPDGSAHRIFVHMGKVTYAKSHEYREDAWVYDHALNQVILIRGSGIQFYYNVGEDGSLTMDLNKIANFTPENRQFFAEGNPFPEQAYTLVRMS